MQQASGRFDQLGNFQTALLLTAVLLGLLAASGGLLAGSAALVVEHPRSAAEAPPAPPPQPRAQVSAQPSRPPELHLRAVTVASVNLRAEPTTAAETLATLPRQTAVELLGDDERSGPAVWRHVRTEDGREGWIIGTALVLERADG